jgi:hypothetical protein
VLAVIVGNNALAGKATIPGERAMQPAPHILSTIDISQAPFLLAQDTTIVRSVTDYNTLVTQINNQQAELEDSVNSLRDLLLEINSYASQFLEGANVVASEQAVASDQGALMITPTEDAQGAPHEFLQLQVAVSLASQELTNAVAAELGPT